jgi:hypothetical protein
MISLALITTNILRRWTITLQTIQSFFICRNNEIIDEIVLSIDLLGDNINEEKLSEETILKSLQDNGFLEKIRVYFKKSNGMMSNQINAIQNCKGNIIIYSEDDIIINRLPTKNNIKKLTNNGVIMYNSCLSYVNGENIFKKENFMNLNDDYFYKKEKNNFTSEYKDYSKGDNLSVCFPCAIMRKEIIMLAYYKTIKNNKMFGIEANLSNFINSMKNMESYIFVEDDSLEVKEIWKSCTNCEELRVKSQPIARNLQFSSLLTEDDKKIVLDYCETILNH